MRLVCLLVFAGCASSGTDSTSGGDPVDTGPCTADVEVWVDGDGDSFGSTGGSRLVCEVPFGWSSVGGDCKDSDPEIHPGVEEACNGIDDDCDGTRDNADTTWYADVDLDGYGDDATGDATCNPPAGYVDVGGDCADGDATVHPGAVEACNTIDDDCDGLADLGYEATWHSDDDGDGFGSPLVSESTCLPDAGWVRDGTDCRPSDGSAYPGAKETCNGVDDSCEGTVDEGFDEDADGHLDEACPTGDDCDDTREEVYVGAREYCDDGIDEDCDGVDKPCAFVGDYDLTSVADVTLPSTTLSDAGRIVKMDDVTGDGVDDLLIAALSSSSGFVVPGPLPLGSNDPATVGYTLSGDGSIVYGSGRSCGLGDITGDGVGDVGFGAPYGSDPGFYVTSGPITQDSDIGDAEFHFTCVSGEYCGHGGTIADVTGDGIADVMMGAYLHSTGAQYGGTVWVAFGPLSGDVSYTAADAELVGTTANAYAGRFIVAGADHDGDGIGDMLVAAPYSSAAASSGGAVFLFLGPPSSMNLSSADAEFDGSANTGYLGEVHAMAQGDIDGDGLADPILGAYYANGGKGGAYVFFGTTSGTHTTSTADITVVGDSASSGIGPGLGGEDLDLDGRGDLMIGSYGAASEYFFYSPSAGSYVGADADATFTGSRGSYLGIGATSGDINADGVPDVVVGAIGAGSGTSYGMINYE